MIFDFSRFSLAYRRNRKAWQMISFCLRHHDIMPLSQHKEFAQEKTRGQAGQGSPARVEPPSF
jgi:hypothetical protein